MVTLIPVTSRCARPPSELGKPYTLGPADGMNNVEHAMFWLTLPRVTRGATR